MARSAPVENTCQMAHSYLLKRRRLWFAPITLKVRSQRLVHIAMKESCYMTRSYALKNFCLLNSLIENENSCAKAHCSQVEKFTLYGSGLAVNC
jgi:hypothetical protein